MLRELPITTVMDILPALACLRLSGLLLGADSETAVIHVDIDIFPVQPGELDSKYQLAVASVSHIQPTNITRQHFIVSLGTDLLGSPRMVLHPARRARSASVEFVKNPRVNDSGARHHVVSCLNGRPKFVEVLRR
jgi:hypothetical protein